MDTVDSIVTGTPEMTGRGMRWGEVVVQESDGVNMVSYCYYNF